MVQATKKDWEGLQKEAGGLLVDLKHQIQDTEDEISGMIQKWHRLTGWDGSVFYDLNGDLKPELWDDASNEEIEAVDAAVVVEWRWRTVRAHLNDMRRRLAEDLQKWTELVDEKINFPKE